MYKRQDVVDLVNNFISHFEYDFEKEAEEVSKNRSRQIFVDEHLKKDLFNALSECSMQNHELALTRIYRRISIDKNTYSASFLTFSGFSNVKDLSEESIEKSYKLNKLCLKASRMYDAIFNNDEKFEEDFLEESDVKRPFSTIYADENLTSRPDPEIDIIIKAAFDKNMISTSLYQNGKDRIFIHDEYVFYPKIGFGQDISLWLDHLKKQTDWVDQNAKGKVIVTMFGQVDDVNPLYSSFVFTIHKGRTIWICSDSIDFDNPLQKRLRLSRAGTWRNREEAYNALDLPYEFFWDLDILRKQQTGLAKKVVKEIQIREIKKEEYREEFFQINEVKFKELLGEELNKHKIVHSSIDISYSHSREISSTRIMLNGYVIGTYDSKNHKILLHQQSEFLFSDFENTNKEKVYFILRMAEYFIDKIMIEEDQPQVMLSKEFIEMKMLEGEQYDPSKETRMQYWDEPQKEVFYDIKAAVENYEKTTALVKKSYDIVYHTPMYSANWLASPEKLESLSEWLILDDEANKLYPKVLEALAIKDHQYSFYDTNSRTHKISSRKLLIDHYNNYFEDILKRCVEYDEVYLEKASTRGFSSNGEVSQILFIHSPKVDEKKVSMKDKEGCGIGKNHFEVQNCRCCNNKASRPMISINVKYWKQFIWLLGRDDYEQARKEDWLSGALQIYRSHIFTPYNGNSLLDQTHPYLRLLDLCQKPGSNGFDISLFVCKTCYNKAVKKYRKGEKLVVKID